jgi:[pyruvate, water dikinase]-phosphate phosphotransferase / [pyruvate, water dikinase] kinase
MYKIFIVSDGTGRTANQLIKAALTQFPETESEIILHPVVRDKNKIKEIIREAENSDAIITHTIVGLELRDYLEVECNLVNIPLVDLIGPLIHRMSDIFSEEPSQDPGLFYQTNQEYFQRIDAVQYAFKHDDGARVEEIDKAEIVLLGVSRTFKTPLSIYLAYNGYFVANIPIIKGIQPPDLKNIDPSKVFCLTTIPNELSMLRATRSEAFGGYIKEYSDIEAVKEELLFANRYFSLHPEWKIINVTNKPIEEIASEILNILIKKRK